MSTENRETTNTNLSNEPILLNAPSCFDRAESNGRTFDNCRYMHECKTRKSICVNNPQ